MKTSTRILLCLVGFIIGAIVTYLVVVISTIFVWDLMGVHDQNGGGAMALGLVIGPAIALIGACVGAILLPAWLGKRLANRPPPTRAEAIADRGKLIIAGTALVGGFVGTKFIDFGFWLASPITFDNYWKAWAVSWLPSLGFLAGALVCGLLAHRVIRNAGG
jgi:hypothetical protein